MFKSHGFTLVELLVVISIIAVLASIGISVFRGATNKATDLKKKSDVASIAKALEENYSVATGKYTAVDSSDFTTGMIVPTLAPGATSQTLTSADRSNTYTITYNPDSTSFTACTTGYCQPSARGIPPATPTQAPTTTPIPPTSIPSPTSTPTSTPAPSAIPTQTPTATPIPPTPTPTSAPTFKYVFVTSQTYDGNLGGLSGADLKCQTLANTAGLRGIYKAWLSNNTTSASSRLAHASIPYKLKNGTIIANNWSDLIDGSIASAIKITESEGITGVSGVMTNTSASGNISPYNYNCDNWSSSQGSSYRILGLNVNMDRGWTDYGANNCTTRVRLYCFEQ